MRRISIIIFYFLALLVSCEVYDFGQNSKENSIGLNSNINSTIIIEAKEELKSNSRYLTLLCRTERIYPCANFSILTENQITDNSINIDFTSVEKSNLCLTALGPARALINLKSLSNGEYQIQLNNMKLKNVGTLVITDTDIKLNFVTKNGIDFIRKNTKRVPKRTYWGTIRYYTWSPVSQVDELMQKLKDIGARFDKQDPGHYYYYEIDNSGIISPEVENLGYNLFKHIIFQYDGDENKLKELVEVDGKDYNETLEIRLETYKGERFSNTDI